VAVKQKVVKLRSCFADGVAVTCSDIEISLSPGIPTFDIIGLCDSSIRESRGRITSAVRSCGYLMPKGHITVNISPAYMHKSGSGFDLPIALGILFLTGSIPYSDNLSIYAQGEVSLGGEIRGTPGAICRLMEADKTHSDIVLIPEDEIYAAACTGIRCMPVRTLRNACEIFEEYCYEGEEYSLNSITVNGKIPTHSLSDLKGQEKASEAITIACSGMHSILMLGSPGSGKSFSAEIIAGLLPDPDRDEISQYLALQELSGTLDINDLSVSRPFRRIYSNCTLGKLKGKAGTWIPGELALANNGLLFADEICEFDPSIIEELKMPLEEHVLRINKDGKTVQIPASFLFAASGNPCRCGMFYEEGNKCRCTPTVRRKYLGKLSGGFLDRIDIFTEMRSVSQSALEEMTSGSDNDALNLQAKQKIQRAWDMQSRRFGWKSGENKVFNGTCSVVDREMFRFDEEVSGIAAQAAKQTGLSGRGYLKLIRVARTIADMKGSENILVEHIKQALIYKVNKDVIR